MKAKIITLSLISIFMTSCIQPSTQETYSINRIHKTYRTFTNAKEKQDLTSYITANASLQHEIGTFLSKGDTILTIYDENEQLNLDTLQFHLQETNTKIATINKEIENIQVKPDGKVVEQMEHMKNELATLATTKKEILFKISKTKVKKQIVANFDGQLIKQNDNFQFISNEKDLKLIVDEYQLITFNKDIEYNMYDLQKRMIGKATFSSMIPEQTNSDISVVFTYCIFFHMKLEEDISLIENQSLLIEDKQSYFLIPISYVLQENEKLFIIDASTHNKIEVKGKLEGEYYIINDGPYDHMNIIKEIEDNET